MSAVIEVHPLSRVEGHGTLRVTLDGSRVARVELSLTESPRLFEALLVGRSFAEVPDIVCRICSLCSTVHKVTALLAVEDAFGVEVSPVTRLTRELILCGGQLQSHALHLYCLQLPDLLGLTGVPGLAAQAPELLKSGLAIKRVGNLIQEAVGGRLIHPVNITLGGLGKRLSDETLDQLRDELDAVLPSCAETWRLFADAYPPTSLPTPAYMAVAPTGSAFSGPALCLKDAAGFPVPDYRSHITEEVLATSHAKSAFVQGAAPCVGALARLNLNAPLTGPVAALFDGLHQELEGADMHRNPLAQALELYQTALWSRDLLDRLAAVERSDTGKARVPPPGAGQGSAACEAPRGVLLHSYSFDAGGICTGADVITPTSLNQAALSADLDALARVLEGAEPQVLVAKLEHLIRCYDPCISCAVHLVQL